MRKRTLSVLLCILILAGVCTAVLAAGGADDPLISASWLYDTLMPRLREMLGKEPSGVTELASEYDDRLSEISFARGSDFDYSGQTTPLMLRADDAVTLDEYGCFTLTDGTAKLLCHDCEVIDLSSGSVCADGSWLQRQHRYFAADGSDAVILVYTDAQGYIDGYYLRESDTVFPPADRYTDTDGHWAEAYIARMTELDAVNGMENHCFAPDLKVTRAMFVTILCRLFGAENGPCETVFTDVKDGDWYAPYIDWAASNGLVIGYGDEIFGPDDPITREQMAAVLARCCAEYGVVLSDETGLSNFSDAEKISEWARDAVDTAYRAGLLTGRDTGEFDPVGTATRGEMCAVFSRLYEKLN